MDSIHNLLSLLIAVGYDGQSTLKMAEHNHCLKNHHDWHQFEIFFHYLCPNRALISATDGAALCCGVIRTHVELHQTGTFKGSSTDWATESPPHFEKMTSDQMFLSGEEEAGRDSEEHRTSCRGSPRQQAGRLHGSRVRKIRLVPGWRKSLGAGVWRLKHGALVITNRLLIRCSLVCSKSKEKLGNYWKSSISES